MSDTKNLVILSDNETGAITNALQVAAERFDEHVKEFTKLAEQLRAGAEMPLWAPGEMGAIAAERTATQFQLQATNARALIARIGELGATVALIPYEE